MWWRKKPDRENRQVLRCAFCNKVQDDVKKLIAGPRVFICDGCVEICNDILADDERHEGRAGSTGAKRTEANPAPWPKKIQCALCRVPIHADEGIVIVNRGMLCTECVDAVEATRQDELQGVRPPPS
jgi:hypothetical protein